MYILRYNPGIYRPLHTLRYTRVYTTRYPEVYPGMPPCVCLPNYPGMSPPYPGGLYSQHDSRVFSPIRELSTNSETGRWLSGATVRVSKRASSLPVLD